jgi:hypothetical protein
MGAEADAADQDRIPPRSEADTEKHVEEVVGRFRVTIVAAKSAEFNAQGSISQIFACVVTESGISLKL